MLNEAKTSRPRPKLRPRPELRGRSRGQFLEVRILHDFCPKNARIHNKTTRSRPGRGQSFEAEAEAKILASRPLWPRGLNITAYLWIGSYVNSNDLEVFHCNETLYGIRCTLMLIFLECIKTRHMQSICGFWQPTLWNDHESSVTTWCSSRHTIFSQHFIVTVVL